ncbi:hypothetical protein PSBY109024_17515 [Pseudoalteromonas byunsanensis]
MKLKLIFMSKVFLINPWQTNMAKMVAELNNLATIILLAISSGI